MHLELFSQCLTSHLVLEHGLIVFPRSAVSRPPLGGREKLRVWHRLQQLTLEFQRRELPETRARSNFVELTAEAFDHDFGINPVLELLQAQALTQWNQAANVL